MSLAARKKKIQGKSRIVVRGASDARLGKIVGINRDDSIAEETKTIEVMTSAGLNSASFRGIAHRGSATTRATKIQSRQSGSTITNTK